MNANRFRLVLLSAAVSGLLCAGAASAQLRALSEQELSTTRGQGLLVLTNSSYNGFDFTRIALGADVKLNANFRNINLGGYARDGYLAPADLDMPLLQYGRSDAGDAKRVVQITDPYIEFVYRNAGNAATREVVGMRFGFGSIAGDVGLDIKTLSGSMQIGGTDYAGIRIAGPLVGGVTAGDAAGASRDFWMSTLKTAVQFQAPAGMTQVPDIAQAGFWMNWRDRLSAINAGGTPPPNLPLVR